MTSASLQEFTPVCADAADATVVQQPNGDPVRIGRYLLRHRIAYGGMGDVFLATMQGAKGFQRTCVVKMMRPDRVTAHHLQMFVDEARITAAMCHPNIVQVYDFGEENGTYYLVLEHLEGEDLASYVGRLRTLGRRMPIPMAVAIVERIARALHHVHAARDDAGAPLQLVHRDVSPANVMVLSTGEVKLLDFGVAKATERFRESHTATGVVKGKLAYMSPEQLTGGRDVDPRTDIWGLGVLLWELLTGSRPYHGATAAEILGRMLRAAPRPPCQTRGEPEPELDRIAMRCLACKPQDRFPSALVVADELRRILDRRPWDPGRIAQEIESVRGVQVSPSTDGVPPVPAEQGPDSTFEPTARTTDLPRRIALAQRRPTVWRRATLLWDHVLLRAREHVAPVARRLRACERRLWSSPRLRPLRRHRQVLALAAALVVGAFSATLAAYAVSAALHVDELAPAVLPAPQRPVIVLIPTAMPPPPPPRR